VSTWGPVYQTFPESPPKDEYVLKRKQILLLFLMLVIKGTVSVISSDPPRKDGYARFLVP